MASTSVRAASLLLPLLLCGTSTVVFARQAVVVPTCRGVPATIIGLQGDDTLNGTNRDDVIVGGGGLDTIDGRSGNDVICGGPTRDKQIDGDWIYQKMDGGPGNDVVIGGSGDDRLFGSEGADHVIGNAGADDVYGGGGIDTLQGGSGSDTLGGERGADRMFGGDGEDWFWDYGGANLFDGGDGADTLSSGPGNDTIKGGRGKDTVSYVDIHERGSSGGHCNDIIADLSRGKAQGVGFGADVLQDIEDVWSGGGNDTLVGDDGPNTFYTGDTYCDQPGTTDSVTGNGGLDRISFNSLVITGSSTSGVVSVDLAANTARWHNPGSINRIVLTLMSIENVTGTEQADVILGDARPNSLSGGGAMGMDGNDVIRGRRGADRLSGSYGNDTLYGGPGRDTITGDAGNDRLYGGLGRNRNDGGNGIDICRRPQRGSFANACER
jgi:Ca2+-binding RTX toxin-like protein